MLVNVKENMKLLETHLKRISLMAPDMKTNNHRFVEEYKASIVATLEMKLLQIGLKFKEIHLAKNNIKTSGSNTSANTSVASKNSPNISRSLFLEQSQEEMMEEIAANEYKDIERSINNISEMYKDTLVTVRMQ